MASHFLNGIALPSGMLWVDEFAWAAAQRSVERSITGAQIIDVVPKVAGRPITLQGAQDQGWIRRATLLAVRALADVPGGQYPLMLATGEQFTVMFAPEEAIDAQPISRPELPAHTTPYVATLRLITV
ncbi:hypothetical protein [Comamonas jiangduensis]|uniref:Uncharacterized protein n=1 Tax=Comamonas jiangduensis TaxID=1194168 RepID=A0ABV4IH94_9BURK